MTEGICIDIGGVVADHATLDGVRRPGGHLAVPEIDGAFDAVRRLRAERFGRNTLLLSMISEAAEPFSRDWLQHTNFYDRTGMDTDQVIYCRDFADKAVIAHDLGLTHAVDDRVEVLRHFTNGETLFLFRPRAAEYAKFAAELKAVSVVYGWQSILDATISKDA
jgi:hypothetical protein